ncbi:MAG: hypothetical protein R2699_05955 [Acidimicrobiales bacterium]
MSRPGQSKMSGRANPDPSSPITFTSTPAGTAGAQRCASPTEMESPATVTLSVVVSCDTAAAPAVGSLDEHPATAPTPSTAATAATETSSDRERRTAPF